MVWLCPISFTLMTVERKRKREESLSSRKLKKLSPAIENDDISAQETYESSDVQEDEWSNAENDNGEDQDWGGISYEAEESVRSGKKSAKPTGEEIRTIKDATDLFRSNTFKLQIDVLLPNIQPKTKRKPPLERFLLSLYTFLSGLSDVSPKHPLEAARNLLKAGVSVPFPTPLPTEETQWKVAFASPSDITIVGSWANKTSVKGQGRCSFGVDLAVEMPSSLFQEKDYLNGRFFHKKAFYLATIAAAIANPNSGLNVDVSYISTNDDPRLTKLVLEPKADGSSTDFTKLNARINIIPTISSTESPIPLHRLSPAHANIRITPQSASASSSFSDTQIKDSSNLPSPTYNNALLTSFVPKSYLLSVHSLQQIAPGFEDALALIRVWANQRGYGESGGQAARISVRGFDGKGPWWAALLMYLILGEESTSAGRKFGGHGKRKPLGKGLSSYQLFRAALDFLAKHDFENEPVFVKAEGGHRYTPDEYSSNHDMVFVDSTSTVNLLAGVPTGSMKLLGNDARRTLETLDDSSTDPFPEVFLMDHRDLQTRFDVVINVDLSNAKSRKFDFHQTLDLGSASNAILSSVSSVLTQALGNRVRAIGILHPTPSTRPLSQAQPLTSHIIHIGLIYNPLHAWRQVDHGPNSASDPDPVSVKKFRDFWGDKAELRRFKDGSIVESVVWDVKTVDEKTLIPRRIVAFVLERHFGIGEEAVRGWQEGFDRMLRLPESVSRYYIGADGAGVGVGFKAALGAFDSVVKAIKALSSDEGNALPLSVMNISPTSESLRYTSVFSPVPLPDSIASVLPPNARYSNPTEFVIEFERSSRWPDDLKAIQKVKLAFLEKLARDLMGRVKGLRATVIAGDVEGMDGSEIRDVARLELITEEGWAFVGRIWHDREAVLLDRIINDTVSTLPHVAHKDKSHRQGRNYHSAIQAREAYTRLYLHAPMHHRAIAKLCHHFPAFAGTVRIAKRWFAAHWLLGGTDGAGYVSEEAVELLCAMFFVKRGWEAEVDRGDEDKDVRGDEQMVVPGSKERGFALLIQFLKDWKWDVQGEGIFVPLYGSSTVPNSKQPKAVAASISTGVWKIRTAMDEEGGIWTMFGPDAIVARRVRALAQATWKCLKEMETSASSEKGVVLSIFDHPTDDYDVIIDLDRALLPRYHQNVSLTASELLQIPRRKQFSNDDELAAASSRNIRPGFDPAMLLCRDLKRIYQDTFRIFHDCFGGDRFGIVWDPSLKQPRPFRVLGGFSFSAESQDKQVTGKVDKGSKRDMVVLNEQGVLGELERLGRGIVSGITIHAR
ncbi:Nrap protein [Lentinula detonsa]|uniref:U3 small nucleolar RNA-associated protein 22 n=1 Tax=Lentinula detonsa TaxID=2804962 RepID=A0AA38PR32_9AGAR|nr:Nrap protein [Lentinula detonsa]